MKKMLRMISVTLVIALLAGLSLPMAGLAEEGQIEDAVQQIEPVPAPAVQESVPAP